jgi:putative glycosyltransferase (TIGR04372 family)
MKNLLKIKKILKNSISEFIRYHLIWKSFAPIIYKLVNLYYYSKIKKIETNTQVFLITRNDFGLYPLLLHYVNCWQNQRTDTTIIILSYLFYSTSMTNFNKHICSKTKFIYIDNFFTKILIFIFGHKIFPQKIFDKMIPKIIFNNPTFINVYPTPLIGDYNQFFDPYIGYFKNNVTKEFLQAYLDARPFLNCNFLAYLDLIKLHYTKDLSIPFFSFNTNLKKFQENLKIEKPYVVININTKDYSPQTIANRRKIYHPERYNCLIDFLIEKNFTVVIQGRKEQPTFPKRKCLIDSSKWKDNSVEKDLFIYSECEFAITSKSGNEIFGTVCNIPTLGLNYTEFCCMQPNLKFRFFPKHIKDKKSDKIFSFEESLTKPFYFDVGNKEFSKTDIEYIEIKEEEIINATEEFLPLINKKPEDWLNLTPAQAKFKSLLHPGHLDLYYIKGLPCDCSLQDN